MAGIILNRSRQAPAEDTPAFGGIAERFRRAGDLDRAIALCRDGLKKFPNQLSARVTLGWALLDKGQYDEARAELEQVLRRAPDNLAAIRGLAELHDRTDSAVSMETPESWANEAYAEDAEAEGLGHALANAQLTDKPPARAQGAVVPPATATSPVAAEPPASAAPEPVVVDTASTESLLVSPAAAAIEAVGDSAAVQWADEDSVEPAAVAIVEPADEALLAAVAALGIDESLPEPAAGTFAAAPEPASAFAPGVEQSPATDTSVVIFDDAKAEEPLSSTALAEEIDVVVTAAPEAISDEAIVPETLAHASFAEPAFASAEDAELVVNAAPDLTEPVTEAALPAPVVSEIADDFDPVWTAPESEPEVVEAAAAFIAEAPAAVIAETPAADITDVVAAAIAETPVVVAQTPAEATPETPQTTVEPFEVPVAGEALAAQQAVQLDASSPVDVSAGTWAAQQDIQLDATSPFEVAAAGDPAIFQPDEELKLDATLETAGTDELQSVLQQFSEAASVLDGAAVEQGVEAEPQPPVVFQEEMPAEAVFTSHDIVAEAVAPDEYAYTPAAREAQEDAVAAASRQDAQEVASPAWQHEAPDDAVAAAWPQQTHQPEVVSAAWQQEAEPIQEPAAYAASEPEVTAEPRPGVGVSGALRRLSSLFRRKKHEPEIEYAEAPAGEAPGASAGFDIAEGAGSAAATASVVWTSDTAAVDAVDSVERMPPVESDTPLVAEAPAPAWQDAAELTTGELEHETSAVAEAADAFGAPQVDLPDEVEQGTIVSGAIVEPGAMNGAGEDGSSEPVVERPAAAAAEAAHVIPFAAPPIAAVLAEDTRGEGPLVALESSAPDLEATLAAFAAGPAPAEDDAIVLDLPDGQAELAAMVARTSEPAAAAAPAAPAAPVSGELGQLISEVVDPALADDTLELVALTDDTPSVLDSLPQESDDYLSLEPLSEPVVDTPAAAALGSLELLDELPSEAAMVAGPASARSASKVRARLERLLHKVHKRRLQLATGSVA